MLGRTSRISVSAAGTLAARSARYPACCRLTAISCCISGSSSTTSIVLLIGFGWTQLKKNDHAGQKHNSARHSGSLSRKLDLSVAPQRFGVAEELQAEK